MESEWTPAIIGPPEMLLGNHTKNPGHVTKYAGQKIRVREDWEIDPLIIHRKEAELGCKGKQVCVHPEDAYRLWPEYEGKSVVVCTCCLLMD